MFVLTDNNRTAAALSSNDKTDIKTSEILSLKNGFGFIRFPPNNLFFHYTSVVDHDFNDLKIGDRVQFIITNNYVGEDVAKNVELI